MTMMFWYGHGMGGWGYALMAIGNVVLWAVLLVAIVALIRYVTRADGRGTGRPIAHRSAEQVLADRFARGEIDEPEYRERLAVLRDPDRPLTRQ